MRRLVCALITFLLLIMFAGCGNSQTSYKSSQIKGTASRVDFRDGWRTYDLAFEYINEHTIKLVRESDGQVFYVPDSSIERIWVSEEGWS